MRRDDWVAHHGFCSLVMDRIDECLAFGGKITAIWDKPLDYEILKYN